MWYTSIVLSGLGLTSVYFVSCWSESRMYRTVDCFMPSTKCVCALLTRPMLGMARSCSPSSQRHYREPESRSGSIR